MIFEKKDTAALRIYKEYRQMEMPMFETFADSTIKAIFHFIDTPPKVQSEAIVVP